MTLIYMDTVPVPFRIARQIALIDHHLPTSNSVDHPILFIDSGHAIVWFNICIDFFPTNQRLRMHRNTLVAIQQDSVRNNNVSG